jgi:hypothetical protein
MSPITLETLKRATEALNTGVPLDSIRPELVDCISVLRIELNRANTKLSVVVRRLMKVEEERNAAVALNRADLYEALRGHARRMSEERQAAVDEATKLRELLGEARVHLSAWVPSTPALAARIDTALGDAAQASNVGGAA